MVDLGPLEVYEPEPGDIFLVPMKGIAGPLIKIGQWLNGDGLTKYQHAGVYVGDGRTVEAYPGGAIVGELDRFDAKKVVWLRCPPAYGDAVATAALSMVGTPYSALDYMALALHRFHIPAPHLKAYIASKGHQICSQLADAAALKGGWHIFADGRWPGYVAPNDLGRVARSQKDGQYVENWKGPR